MRFGDLSRRLPVILLVGLSLAGLLEAYVAWQQNRPTVSPADWDQTERFVRAHFRPGDLLVFAPAWYDPVGRRHLGDLLTLDQVSRPDDATYGRIWVVARRGTSYHMDTHGPTNPRLAERRAFGGLTVSRYEQRPLRVVYDFFEHLPEAQVSLQDRSGRRRGLCPWKPATKRHQCPRGWNNVRQKLAEIDYRLRRCIYAHPTDREILVIRFPAAQLGDRLVVWSGLDDYDARLKARRAVRNARKKGREPKRLYPVHVAVRAAGKLLGSFDHPIDEAWHRHVFPTQPAGPLPVQFEISTRYAYAKIFCFMAQARTGP